MKGYMLMKEINEKMYKNRNTCNKKATLHSTLYKMKKKVISHYFNKKAQFKTAF